nr:tetratricopeptide repeat protein [Acidipropionibacterium jensenii]
MSAQSFNRPGAVDLSDLAARAQFSSAPASAAAGSPGPTGASWVALVDDEQGFNDYVQKSVQHPVLIEFTSAQAHSEAMDADLDRITNEAAGRWILVRVDADKAPQLAQALQIQALPTLLPIVGGQPISQPIQGTLAADQIRQLTDQVSQLAVANGIAGHAAPVSQAAVADTGEDAGPDPRTTAAEALIDQGRYDEAVAGYDELLAKTPADPVLTAGRARAALLSRLAGSNQEAVLAAADEAGSDVDAQLAAADVELIGGDPGSAFRRILAVIRTSRDEDREKARLRLLELFEMVGDDPTVASARRALAAALF